jgi:hypothetical protein
VRLSKWRSNYAFKPIAELVLRSNQNIVPQRLNAALAFVPALGRVSLSFGWSWSALVAVAEDRWVVFVEKQSRAEQSRAEQSRAKQSKAREVRKSLKSRGLGLFAGTEAGTGSPWGLVGRAVWFGLMALNLC